MQEQNSIHQDIGIESENSYISVDEMAKMLSIARVTAYQLIKTSGFPCFYIGKRIIIPLHTFRKWTEEQASCQTALSVR